MDSAGFGSDVLGFGAGVFSAIHRAQGIDFANGFAAGIISQTGADLWQLTAGAALQAFAPAALRYGQKSSYCPPDFGAPGVFR